MGKKTQYAHLMVGQMKPIDGQTHTLLQWEYHSTKTYADPFNEIVLDVHLTTPSGKKYIIPTFWMGKQHWAVRFTPEETGIHRLITVCSDTQNSALHAVEDEILVTQGNQTAPLQLKVSEDKTHLTTKENTPFFWLSDTWWMALSKRLAFPKDFKRLTSKRKEQGFNVIMLVAGLFPDMDSFDTRCANEAGLPWIANTEGNYDQINPTYFDEADKRIAHLVEEGFIPCILGSWGYYLLQMGEEKMQQHWRYIIARWGAYPVVWCIAGEATMPYYLSKHRSQESQTLKKGWTEMAKYIKDIEPFGRLLTVHPTEIGRKQLTDESLIDINLLQASHHGYGSVSKSISLLHQEYPNTSMPSIMSEVNYEGILQDTHAAVQRLTFWSAILSGSKGFGYGANGIWQVNTPTLPFGASPHGSVWGDTPWQESLLYDGAKQIGYAKRFLSTYTWETLVPQQHLLEPSHDLADPKAPRCGGVEDTLRLLYFYGMVYPNQAPYRLKGLDPQKVYHYLWWNPRTGVEKKEGVLTNIDESSTPLPIPPTLEDWVMVIQVQQGSNKNISKNKTSFLSVRWETYPTVWKTLKTKIKKIFK